MPIPPQLAPLRLPAIAAPMFLTSGPDLVIATCNAGIVGTFPALNQRTTEGFSDWLARIGKGRAPDAAPYGVNLIVHKSNTRLEADLETAVRHRVPLIITSLGAVPELVKAVHGYGGLVFHDVINLRHARKAAEAGVDGIIAVSAGAGGHAGTTSPFALVSEIREIFGGTIILGGAISTGAQIAAARLMGADLAYLGTRFLATREAMVPEAYKDMVVRSHAADILYTSKISGVSANFLRPSILARGLDPDNLPSHGELNMASESRAWSKLWSAGQGCGAIHDIPGVAELSDRLAAQYWAAMNAARSDPFARPPAAQ